MLTYSGSIPAPDSEPMSSSTQQQSTSRRLTCRVAGMTQFNHEIMQVLLQPDPPECLHFRPGQYINIVLNGQEMRPFSLANAPREDNLIELHIRHNAGGRFARWLQHDLDEDTRVIIEGPHGEFSIHDSTRPIIMVAGGTGFAPIKSLIEHIIHEQIDRTVYLYWGARTREDLYLQNMAQRWGRLHDNIHFVPVLSEEPPAAGVRTGLVHEAVLEDFPGLENYEVYVCGPVGLIRAVQETFLQYGLDEKALFSDMFAFLDNE